MTRGGVSALHLAAPRPNPSTAARPAFPPPISSYLLIFPCRGALKYVPFAKKLEALSQDADVNSVLGYRCSRNDRGTQVAMATSYPWLANMTTATGKEDAVLKDSMGPSPRAGVCLHITHHRRGHDCMNLYTCR